LSTDELEVSIAGGIAVALMLAFETAGGTTNEPVANVASLLVGCAGGVITPGAAVWLVTAAAIACVELGGSVTLVGQPDGFASDASATDALDVFAADASGHALGRGSYKYATLGLSRVRLCSAVWFRLAVLRKTTELLKNTLFALCRPCLSSEVLAFALRAFSLALCPLPSLSALGLDLSLGLSLVAAVCFSFNPKVLPFAWLALSLVLTSEADFGVTPALSFEPLGCFTLGWRSSGARSGGSASAGRGRMCAAFLALPWATTYARAWTGCVLVFEAADLAFGAAWFLVLTSAAAFGALPALFSLGMLSALSFDVLPALSFEPLAGFVFGWRSGEDLSGGSDSAGSGSRVATLFALPFARECARLWAGPIVLLAIW
jgi:hypothetical protein